MPIFSRSLLLTIGASFIVTVQVSGNGAGGDPATVSAPHLSPAPPLPPETPERGPIDFSTSFAPTLPPSEIIFQPAAPEGNESDQLPSAVPPVPWPAQTLHVAAPENKIHDLLTSDAPHLPLPAPTLLPTAQEERNDLSTSASTPLPQSAEALSSPLPGTDGDPSISAAPPASQPASALPPAAPGGVASEPLTFVAPPLPPPAPTLPTAAPEGEISDLATSAALPLPTAASTLPPPAWEADVTELLTFSAPPLPPPAPKLSPEASGEDISDFLTSVELPLQGDVRVRSISMATPPLPKPAETLSTSVPGTDMTSAIPPLPPPAPTLSPAAPGEETRNHSISFVPPQPQTVATHSPAMPGRGIDDNLPSAAPSLPETAAMPPAAGGEPDDFLTSSPLPSPQAAPTLPKAALEGEAGGLSTSASWGLPQPIQALAMAAPEEEVSDYMASASSSLQPMEKTMQLAASQSEQGGRQNREETFEKVRGPMAEEESRNEQTSGPHDQEAQSVAHGGYDAHDEGDIRLDDHVLIGIRSLEGGSQTSREVERTDQRYKDFDTFSHAIEETQLLNDTRKAYPDVEESNIDKHVVSYQAAENVSMVIPPYSEQSRRAEEEGWFSDERRLSHIPSATKVTSFPIELSAGGNSRGKAQQQLDQPFAVWRDSATGQYYVSDTMNHRVQRWSPGVWEVETVAGGAGPGRGLHQLKYPKGIFMNGTTVWVADSGNHRIVRWEAQGTSGVVVAGKKGVLLDKQGAVRGYDVHCCRQGFGERQLRDPHGVFVDSDGVLYIADTGNDRVQRWNGNTITTIAGKGMHGLNAVLRRPEAVFVWSKTVYVADTGQHQVVSFAPGSTTGRRAAGGNGLGSRIDQLAGPTGIWLDDSLQENGVRVLQLYVADTFNHRVIRVRQDSGLAAVAAGECLLSPEYISPCINGGLHYPPDPSPDGVDRLNPSNANPPIYHFWGPTGVFVSTGAVNITVVDTQNHRVLTWLQYR